MNSEFGEGYTLGLIGSEDLINLDACKGLLTFRQRWHSLPFIVGRTTFKKLPSELMMKISRQHFQIECTKDTNFQKHYWLLDLSGNGTFINGKRVGRSTKVPLKNGDQIGIAMLPSNPSEVEFGYTFTRHDT